MQQVRDLDKIDKYVVVLTSPDMTMRDSRTHLLFSSIVSLNSNYHVYLIGSNTDIAFAVALLYISTSRVTELITINKILDDPTIDKILPLKLGIFINNPEDLQRFYIPKLSKEVPYIPHAEPLIPSPSGLLYMDSSLVSDIYVHLNNDKAFNLITKGSNVKISCILVVKNELDDTLEKPLKYSLQCYQNQTHQNKELVIVAPLKLKGKIGKYTNFAKYRWIDTGGDQNLPMMINLGFKMCSGDYILCLNINDWYHPALFSILADHARFHDYVSLSHIITMTDKNFFLSKYKFQGWEQILMIRYDKFVAIPDIEEWESVYVKIQWECCDAIYIFEHDYGVLYVHKQPIPNGTKLSQSLQEYYEAIIGRYYDNFSMTYT